MNHRTTLIAGLAVGFAVVAPGAALAATGTPAPTTPTSPTATVPTKPTAPAGTEPTTQAGVPKAYVSVSPRSGVPGQKVTVATGCELKDVSKLASDALDIGKLRPVGPQDDPATAPRAEAAATVKKAAKPGVHKVSFDCGGATITTSFTVLTPQSPVKTGQVTKVPAGAPQTGGGGTAGDPASYTGLIAALSAAAVLTAGAGVVVYRRRLARQD
jgi:hypothetical protein